MSKLKTTEMEQITWQQRYEKLFAEFFELTNSNELTLNCIIKVCNTHIYDLVEAMENDTDDWSSEYWQNIINTCNDKLEGLKPKVYEITIEDFPKLSKKGHTAHVNLFVHPELVDVYTSKASENNVPVSRLYRQALEMYLETTL